MRGAARVLAAVPPLGPVLVLASLLLLGGCSVVSATMRAPAAALLGGGGELHQLPVVTEDGDRLAMTVRLCRPAGRGPFPAAVLNHDGAATQADRDAVAPARCDAAPVRWFLDRSYVVVLPVRRGFGDSQSNWVANPGPCANPDYVQAGLAGARDIEAAVGWAASLPFVDPAKFVLVGAGEGGWATLAYTSQPDRRIAAAIVIAAGMGGRAGGIDRRTCRPDRLAEAAAQFGATSRVPTLWVYPTADATFTPELATALHDAFTRTGGRATFAHPDTPGGPERDWLFSDTGAQAWETLAATFLKS